MIAYEMRVPIAQDSRAWETLLAEIPRGATMEQAFLVLTPRRASVDLHYRGKGSDGEPHKRRSHHSVTLDPTEKGGGEFIKAAFGKGRYTQTLMRLLPTGQGG